VLQSDLRHNLPTSDELPCSDDTPVTNRILSNFLLFCWNSFGRIALIGFGVDMGIYHTSGVNPRVPVVPDGFLSLGVERRKQSKPQKLVWEEELSDWRWRLCLGHQRKTQGSNLRKLGLLYYIIYNPEFWQQRSPPTV